MLGPAEASSRRPQNGALAPFRGRRPLASVAQVTLEAFGGSRDGPGEVSPPI